MSSTHSLYYGIYLVGEGKRQIEVDGNRSCPNGHKVVRYNDKFCTECGAELVTAKVMETISFSDVVHEENEDFVIANYCTLKERNRLANAFSNAYVESSDDILMPNDIKIFGVYFGDDEGVCSSDVPFDKVMVISEVERLLAVDIELLHKVLYEKVTVQFGSISTWG